MNTNFVAMSYDVLHFKEKRKWYNMIPSSKQEHWCEQAMTLLYHVIVLSLIKNLMVAAVD